MNYFYGSNDMENNVCAALDSFAALCYKVKFCALSAVIFATAGGFLFTSLILASAVGFALCGATAITETAPYIAVCGILCPAFLLSFNKAARADLD